MNYKEVVKLKEKILRTCGNVDHSSIIVVNPNKQNNTSQGYQLHIANLYLSRAPCLQTIIQEHHLAIKEELGKTIIYKPIPAS